MSPVEPSLSALDTWIRQAHHVPVFSRMSKSIITAHNLLKCFGDLVAVNRIEFEINEGECFGFLGSQRRRQDLDDEDDLLFLAGYRGN